MAKSQRREQNKPTHQAIKASEAAKAKRRKINWSQILLLLIGILVISSMVLSLFIVPGF